MNKICPLCLNLIKKFNSSLCRECYLSNSDLFKSKCKKGKKHQSYTTGVYVNRIKNCIDCDKLIKNIYAERCHSCEMKRRHQEKQQITRDTVCEHHLDLNPLNNKNQTC